MGSRRLATVDLDPVRTASDLAASQQFRYNDSYAEFVSIGRLYSTMLWNQSGELDESSLGDYDGPAQQTPNGRALPYFSEVLGRLFRMDRLKYLRFMRIAPGTVYVPHRDFLELKTQMLRIHLPVQTDDMVFASEENTVFRMRLGELWQLDASRTHCVGSFSTADRIHLVCDFVADSLDQVLIDQVPDGRCRRRTLWREQIWEPIGCRPSWAWLRSSTNKPIRRYSASSSSSISSPTCPETGFSPCSSRSPRSVGDPT